MELERDQILEASAKTRASLSIEQLLIQAGSLLEAHSVVLVVVGAQ